MSKIFQTQPVRPAGPSDNKKATPVSEKKDSKQGETEEKAPKMGHKGRHG